MRHSKAFSIFTFICIHNKQTTTFIFIQYILQLQFPVYHPLNIFERVQMHACRIHSAIGCLYHQTLAVFMALYLFQARGGLCYSSRNIGWTSYCMFVPSNSGCIHDSVCSSQGVDFVIIHVILAGVFDKYIRVTLLVLLHQLRNIHALEKGYS